MKTAFAFLILLICTGATAQDCATSLLFKKGTVLTYKNYTATGGMFKFDYTEVTRLVFTVKDVKDSGSSHYSYITKTGINSKDESQHYEKTYVVVCDGTGIHIPADFYLTDTVYFSNLYFPNKDKGYNSVIALKEDVKYDFPLDIKNGNYQTSPNLMTLSVKMRSYASVSESGGSRMGSYRDGRIVNSEFEAIITNITFKDPSDETVTTSAGNYKCKKMTMDLKAKVKGNGSYPGFFPIYYYYSPLVGLVKTEGGWKKKIFNYMELSDVKK